MRIDVSFSSSGLQCRGWLYRPEPPAPDRVPVVVMAHGFSAVKEMFLEPFAERFVEAGLAVLLFDFRYLGGSEGEPRGRVLFPEQQEDYRNAITWVSRQEGIDPERIGIWGTSYSGGHVLHVAAFDRRVRAAVAQVPAVSVWRQILRSGGREVLDGLSAATTADRVARFEGRPSATLPVVAPPGQPCVLAAADAWDWFEKRAGSIAPTWRNEVTLESLEKMIEYDAANAIELIAPTPLLMIAAAQDSLISIDLVREVFARAGEPSELRVLDCGHFDVYDAEPWFSEAAGGATAWFRKHLG